MRSLTLNRKVKAIFIERINHTFKTNNKTDQASGLSNCINHFIKSLDDTVKVQVNNVGDILNAINKFRPEKLIVEGIWLGEKDLALIRSVHKNLDLWVHVHSNIPFLVAESIAFGRFKNYSEIGVGIIFNSLDAYLMLNKWRSVYLPNLYSLESDLRSCKEKDQYLDVGCFGSMRPLKNQIAQAISAINAANQIQKTLRFHVNYNRSEGGQDVKRSIKDVFSANLNHQLISVPWFSQSDFISYLKKLDLGMQVSLSETFNLVAADYVTAGIPMVVSREVYWADESSFVSIHHSQETEWKLLDLYEKSNAEANRKALREHQQFAKDRWNAFLEQ